MLGTETERTRHNDKFPGMTLSSGAIVIYLIKTEKKTANNNRQTNKRSLSLWIISKISFHFACDTTSKLELITIGAFDFPLMRHKWINATQCAMDEGKPAHTSDDGVMSFT